MEGITRTVRQALRSLLRHPAFTWAAVLLLGLGIGAVTSAFTIVDNVLLRALPYPAADRLYYMTNGAHSGPVLERLGAVEGVDEWVFATGRTVNLTRDGAEPLRLQAREVTASFFSVFGARPAAGRLLVAADHDRTDVAVVAHGTWTRIWGRDTDLVGTVVRLNGEPVTVVGVVGEGFVPPEGLVGRSPDLYVPMNRANPNLEDPGYHAHSVVARLEPGVSVDRVDRALDRVAEDVARAYPDHYGDRTPRWPLEPLAETTVGESASRGLLLLLGAVGLLLAVACANVAHLFLARGVGRSQEMAVRRALGAGTSQLSVQLLVESLLVGVGGGLLGLAVARVTLEGFARWTRSLPRGDQVVLDPRVLGFAVLLTVGTALVFGLLPALRSARRDLGDGLKAGSRSATAGRGERTLRAGLVVGEVAGSLVLIAFAGLLVRSFVAVTGQDAGVAPERVHIVPLTPPAFESAEEYARRMGAVAEALRGVPGVESATWGMELPFEFVGGGRCCWSNSMTIAEGDEPVRILGHYAGRDWFRTLGTELVAGESWGPVIDEASPPMVVSEGLAVRGWGSAERALGGTLEIRGRTHRIVGVAEPTLHYGLDQPHEHAAYVPMESVTFPIPRATFAVKIEEGREDGVAAALRRAVWSAEPDIPVPTVRRLESLIDESTSARSLGALVASAFGVLALLLAAGGLYGTLLYSVGEQERAIGIRMALGAGRGRIRRRIVGRAVVLSLVGVALGGAAAWYLSGFAESFLFGVAPRDGVSLLTAASVLLVSAAAAAWLPARRASRTDPLEALRAE